MPLFIPRELENPEPGGDGGGGVGGTGAGNGTLPPQPAIIVIAPRPDDTPPAPLREAMSPQSATSNRRLRTRSTFVAGKPKAGIRI